MELVSAQSLLTSLGLHEPDLTALQADERDFTTMLVQPRGELRVHADGVRHESREDASSRFSEVFRLAAEKQVDLMVSPECSVPWETLFAALEAGIRPGTQAAWVLGCEGVRLSQLEAWRDQFAGRIAMAWESGIVADDEKFVNCIAFVLMARADDQDSPTPVVLIQFKVHPIVDDDHFELSRMQAGTAILSFGAPGGLRLVALNCADVMNISDAFIESIHDRSLILHLQLNMKPRQDQYRRYRDSLFRYDCDSTELICLNWAENVVLTEGDRSVTWSEPPSSAWYLHPNRMKISDSMIDANHAVGLYYTRFQSQRSHAMYFYPGDSLFLIEGSKVARIGVVASRSRPLGPKVIRNWRWNPESGEYEVQSTVDDRFEASLSEIGGHERLVNIARTSPLAVERLLALSAGAVWSKADSSREFDAWYEADHLDTCSVSSTEQINRITVGHEIDPKIRAEKIARIQRFKSLERLVAELDPLPAQISDLTSPVELSWDRGRPHQNASGSLGGATLVYLGEETTMEAAQTVSQRLADLLHRSITEPGPCLASKQRLMVWFKDQGVQRAVDNSRFWSIAHVDSEPEVSITGGIE